MTIDYILNNIFSEENIKWHCKDINSKAMAAFNYSNPFGTSFYEPIIDVKEVVVKKEWLVNIHNLGDIQDMVKVVCLINSDDKKDINKGLTVREILERLKAYDRNLYLCRMNKNYTFGWVPSFINVYDGTNNDRSRCYNIPSEFNGIMTNFIT